MEIFKIVGIGIISCVVVIVVKQVRPEFAITVLVSTTILILIYIFNYFIEIFSFFKDVVDKTGIDANIFTILIKIIGVGYLVEFGASICEDSGNSSIANKVLLAGKISIFILAIPIIKNLFNLLLGLL